MTRKSALTLLLFEPLARRLKVNPGKGKYLTEFVRVTKKGGKITIYGLMQKYCIVHLKFGRDCDKLVDRASQKCEHGYHPPVSTAGV